MDDQVISIKVANDGTVAFDENTAVVLKKMAEELSNQLNRPVTSYAVAVGILICRDQPRQDSGNRLKTCVEWVLDRIEQAPDQPISHEEIDSIAETGRPPLLLRPRVRVADGEIETTIDATPFFQRVVGPLQKMLDLPVEQHHIFFALGCLLDDGTYVLGEDLELEHPHNLDAMAGVLRNAHAEYGRLPCLTDESTAEGA